jgi:mRNA interferase RelE/StbE
VKYSKNYKIELKKSAAKELIKIPKTYQQQIIDGLKVLESNPNTQILDIKKLQTKGDFFRLRIGLYRVIYEVRKSQVLIYVIKIAHRKEVYKKLK